MVYSNKFVVCVLVNGVPQEELKNDTVSLPFGTEYVLRFRNKHNRRACVDIYLDGECVSGGGYVIEANDFIDVKRHHDKDCAFKFVSLNSPDAIDHGKNGPNDDKSKGLIEAKFRLEKEHVKEVFISTPYPVPMPYPVYPQQPWRPYWDHQEYKTTCDSNFDSNAATNDSQPTGGAGGIISSHGVDASTTLGFSGNETRSLRSGSKIGSHNRRSRSRSSQITTQSFTPPVGTPLEDGCTVEGNSTGQRFTPVHVDLESTETILKLFLQGFNEVIKSRTKKKSKKNKQIDDLQRQLDELKKELHNSK